MSLRHEPSLSFGSVPMVVSRHIAVRYLHLYVE
jgi:hypothetical protein